MASKYNPGDAVYVVESSRFVREAKIVKYAGGLYTIRFSDSGGGIKVRENRLFPTKEEAQATTLPPESPKHPTPWDCV